MPMNRRERRAAAKGIGIGNGNAVLSAPSAWQHRPTAFRECGLARLQEIRKYEQWRL